MPADVGQLTDHPEVLPVSLVLVAIHAPVGIEVLGSDSRQFLGAKCTNASKNCKAYHETENRSSPRHFYSSSDGILPGVKFSKKSSQFLRKSM
jgi:hypothetical protein